MSALGLRLTPHGRLLLEADAGAPPLEAAVAGRLEAAFARGTGHGLLHLGAVEVGTALPPTFLWWRGFAARYVGALCHRTTDDGTGGEPSVSLPLVPPPDEAALATLLLTAPMMTGAETLSAELLTALWQSLAATAGEAFAASGAGDLQAFLKGLNPAWNLVGRVHFNLAENRRDPDAPFAFLATYTSRLSAQAKAQHVPLGQALREFAGPANRDKLLGLLTPVQRASQHCGWLRPMVDSGELFHPLRWSAAEAARFLHDVPALEQAGVIVRMPAVWRARRPPRPKVTAAVGTRPPSAFGLDGLLDFKVEVTLDGAPLSTQEIAELLAGTEALVMLRGQWVELDRDRLDRTLSDFRAAEALAARDGLSFAEAMRLLAGSDSVGGAEDDAGRRAWSQVTAGPWLAETLRALRAPDGAAADPGPALKATLRPYQQAGVQWMNLVTGLGLGACLADDMGLGKTIQVLALLLLRSATNAGDDAGPRCPSLLVAPASLLANWSAELDRFAPTLRARVIHASSLTPKERKALTPAQFADLDLAITSYGALLRVPVLAATDWQFLILDEAQAIKNPAAKQTKAAKALSAKARIALTGTPVENHLGDLWSIFDVINPGLLGSAKQFKAQVKALADRPDNPYGPLRDLVRPYILRRLKTDKTVIADLPEKTEIKALCALSRKQAALYEQTVAELNRSLLESDGIERKGIVLTTLLRLKQICNHPSQWLADGPWAEADSGKLERLREIASVVAARQEKMLVFTQFREATAPLDSFLTGVFGRPGLVLHGGTAVKRRKALVERFQDDEAVPFFILSLKAGGAGLTLTAASHVVHFDRWWNPAVENQATDRAFRIGQRRNVMVHKFVCRGTMEEKVDALIETKRAVSEDVLGGAGGGGEVPLTEMSNEEIMRLVSLDLSAAVGA